MNSANSKILESVCPMDCPDSCSLEVEIKDNKIHRIGGSHKNPTTQGFICTKIARFAQRVYSPERILYPMKRAGKKGSGKFERITWQEAAEIICHKFKQIVANWGGEAILPYSYGGSNGLLHQDTLDREFFARLGASRLARVVCAAPTTEVALSMNGKMPGTAFEDYVYSKCIIIWGANPKVSNIHLVPYLKKARARGAKIAVVDPKRNFSAKEIDLHLPVYPGTDLVVALAMIRFYHEINQLNWPFIKEHTRGIEILLEKARPYTFERAAEIARVKSADIEKLARLYLENDPAVIRVGWGIERNRNGGQAVAAILALPAVLGKFGKRGGGYTLSNSAAYKYDSRSVSSYPWNTRVLNMNHLGKILTREKNPPIMGLFVYNCNPVATVPNQKAVLTGLLREDLFTVVHEQVFTDTAQLADIVLPAPTFLEQTEIKSAYGTYALQYLEPVIPPVGEAKSNFEVFALLAHTMGWNDPVFRHCAEEYLQKIIKNIRGMGKNLSLEKLKQEKIEFFDFPDKIPIQFQNVFPWTSDQKINLTPAVLGHNPFHYSEIHSPYPLTLISPATEKTINSSLGEYNLPRLFLTINPRDAKTRGIKSGDLVKVYNDLAEVVVEARLSENIRPGVVAMPKGAWRRTSKNNLTSTALVPDHVNQVGGGACFNDARVEVAKVKGGF
ncbi:MAG: molybdopterin oxidoreductase family protein [Calditrichaeota bacterium]|nr:MAG: molybdopterin oxidoreductase family protein [Calditrichota bacterium]